MTTCREAFIATASTAEWTIPHFEKMLYDQAMALWSYSPGAQGYGQRALQDNGGKDREMS